MAFPGWTANNSMAGTPQALAATYKTMLGLNSASGTALKAIALWEFDFGQISAPNATDCPVQYDVSTMTAAGTGTATTPITTVNGFGSTSLIVATGNYTAEPTVTAASSIYNKGVNQRGAAFWQAAPGGEVYYPATNLKGPVLRALSPTYTGTVISRANYSEC
jgi:hypothetical protein